MYSILRKEVLGFPTPSLLSFLQILSHLASEVFHFTGQKCPGTSFALGPQVRDIRACLLGPLSKVPGGSGQGEAGRDGRVGVPVSLGSTGCRSLPRALALAGTGYFA